MIKKELVEEILSRISIEDVISPYTPLKKAGAMLKGLCPFHSEKTPSFTVYTKDNSFFCFGCGAGGDAITFLKRIENMTFEDAVEDLAKRVGITIPVTDTEPGERRFNKERIYELNREAAKYFHMRLLDDTKAAADARAYLLEKRGLSMATVKHFGLGFAPYDPRGFLQYFRSLGFRDDELIAADLIGKSEKNGLFYQCFRDRVMFPIIDVGGRVVAFGGRDMGTSPQKYRNSADTPVFKKSKTLYALNFARQSCGEELIVCEGYMDVIAMHAAGFTNAVATLGTAITPEHARLMSKYTKKIILSYDSDAAGQKATTNALALLEPLGLTATVLRITDAKDPDEYIKKFGAAAFKALLAGSRSKFEFNLEKILSAHDIRNPQEKINACNKLCYVISEVYSAAEREVYITEISKRLEIEASGIRSDVNRLIARRSREAKRKERDSLVQAAAGYGDRVNPDRMKNPKLYSCENAVLSMLLLYPEFVRLAKASAVALTEDDFFTALGKRILTFILEHSEDGKIDHLALNQAFSDDEISRITEIKLSRMALTENSQEVFYDHVGALRAAMQEYTLSRSADTLEGLDGFIQSLRNAKKED